MDQNPCIRCSVDECKYHSAQVDYCTLNNIQVGKCDAQATQNRNTDCESFEVKQSTY